MRKYRLVDKELQKQLDQINNGSFSENLAKLTKLEERNYVYFGESSPNISWKFLATFTKEELEEYEAYDPDEWNDFPKVTPPEKVMMRIEIKDGTGFKAYCTKAEEGLCWHTADGLIMPEVYCPIRFRPWDND